MKNEKINALYDQIIRELSEGNRSLPKMNDEIIHLLIAHFETFDLESFSPQIIELELRKIFCILSNTQTTSLTFHPLLSRSFEIIKKYKLSNNVFILFLSAIQKQVIDHASKTGDRIPEWTMNLLKTSLKSSDPEILEWTLRTIESLGLESLKFYAEIKTLRPNILKIFNAHQRHAFEIVELLEKQWARLKK